MVRSVESMGTCCNEQEVQRAAGGHITLSCSKRQNALPWKGKRHGDQGRKGSGKTLPRGSLALFSLALSSYSFLPNPSNP